MAVEQTILKENKGIYLINFGAGKTLQSAEFGKLAAEMPNCTEKLFWNHIKSAKNQITPIYGIDNHCSLFPNELDIWNLNKLTGNDSMIHRLDVEMPGVLSSLVNHGLPYTSFGFHVEDSYLASINLVHTGDSKIWYVVPHSEAHKLEKFTKEALNQYQCDLLLRHKLLLIPPSVLKKNNIRFSKVNLIYVFIKISIKNAYF